jgi:HD-like signal output (HDOD) protein
MQQLVATIEMDPSLTSRIIGVANSAYFGSRMPIYTVNDAVTRVLGTNNVFSIALSVVLAGPFKANKCPGFHLELYWAEALKTALLAQTLAAQMKNVVPAMADKAYLCGLLHNLGLLVLAHAFPDKVSQVVSIETVERERDITAVEERLIGIDRRRAGAILARKWHLPAEITAVIEHCHDGAYRGEHWQLNGLVALCARCSHALATGQPSNPDAALLEPLQLSAQTVEHSVARMRDKVSEIHTMALMLAMQ